MRIGSFEIKRQRRVKKTVKELATEYLASQEAREIVARMARSEVKNYLAELAEGAEMPFGDGASFLAYVRGCVVTAGKLELEHRIFGSDAEREQAKRNLRLVDAAFSPDIDLSDDKTWDQLLNDEFEEVGPPLTPEQQNLVNLNKTGFVSDEELDEANIRRGED